MPPPNTHLQTLEDLQQRVALLTSRPTGLDEFMAFLVAHTQQVRGVMNVGAVVGGQVRPGTPSLKLRRSCPSRTPSHALSNPGGVEDEQADVSGSSLQVAESLWAPPFLLPHAPLPVPLLPVNPP